MMHAANKIEDLMRTVACKIALCTVSRLSLAAAAVQAAPDAAGPSATARDHADHRAEGSCLRRRDSAEDRCQRHRPSRRARSRNLEWRRSRHRAAISQMAARHPRAGRYDRSARRYTNQANGAPVTLEARSGGRLRLAAELEARHAFDRHRLRLSLAHEPQSRSTGNEP